MARDQWNVDVATFSDGLAVVHGFENGEKSRMLLYQTRECVKISRTAMRSEGAPFWRGGARRANRRVDVSNIALRNGSQLFAVRGIERVEKVAARGRVPRPADEVSKTPAVAFQPRSGFFGIFQGG